MSLVQIMVLLVVVGAIVVLLGLYFYYFKTKESGKEEVRKREFKDIMEVVKDQESNQNELAQAIALLKSDFPLIDDENAQEHYEFIYYLSKHKNITSKQILDVDKFLKQGNPDHQKMLERYGKKGLDDR